MKVKGRADKMSKGLSSLEHLIGRLQNQTATILNNEKDEEKKRKYEKLAFELMFEDKAIIEKELKALDIINERNVDVLRIKITQNVEQYNKRKIKGCKTLSKEAYDILKEVLL